MSVAFNADAELSELMRMVKESGTVVAIVAAVLLAAVGLVWLLRRRRHLQT